MDALVSLSPVAAGPTMMYLSNALKQRMADVNASRDLFTTQQSTSAPSRASSITAGWDTIADGNSAGTGDPASPQLHQLPMGYQQNSSYMQELYSASPLLLPLLLAVLSLCTSLVNVATYARFRELQTTSRRILAAASLADATTSVLHVACLCAASGSEGGAGDAAATLLRPWLVLGMNFGQQSSMMLNAAFVLRTYVTAVHGLAPLPRFAAAVAVVAPLLAVAPPSLALALGTVRNRCRGDGEWSGGGGGYDVMLMEPFRLTAIVAVMAMCLAMDRHITKEVSAANSQYGTYPAIRAAQGLQRKMRVFPLLFLAVNVPRCYWAWSMLVGVALPRSPTTSPIMVLSYHGQSLGNFVLFCLAATVARRCSTDMLLSAIVGRFQTKSLAPSNRKPLPQHVAKPGNSAHACNMQGRRSGKQPQVEGRMESRLTFNPQHILFIPRSHRTPAASQPTSLTY